MPFVGLFLDSIAAWAWAVCRATVPVEDLKVAVTPNGMPTWPVVIVGDDSVNVSAGPSPLFRYIEVKIASGELTDRRVAKLLGIARASHSRGPFVGIGLGIVLMTWWVLAPTLVPGYAGALTVVGQLGGILLLARLWRTRANRGLGPSYAAVGIVSLSLALVADVVPVVQ